MLDASTFCRSTTHAMASPFAPDWDPTSPAVLTDQRAAYDLAIESMAAGAVGADAQEGFAAFFEKRPPVFNGRP